MAEYALVVRVSGFRVQTGVRWTNTYVRWKRYCFGTESWKRLEHCSPKERNKHARETIDEGIDEEWNENRNAIVIHGLDMPNQLH
jgi:hypothetical protein